jgi:UDP-glucose 4-epimerase
MRVVITGASGNVGTSLIESLASEDGVTSILGIERRIPRWNPPKTEWAAADVVTSDLVSRFRGADAVVHLAWLIQPSRDLPQVRTANIAGSESVFDAAAAAGVPNLIYASSVGAYSKGPKDRSVDESWPTGGIPTSFYSRQKAAVEELLDRFERDQPSIRVVRMRPALIFKSEAASEIRRLFAGPFLPNFLIDRRLIPVVPRISGLRFQAVHSHDVADAYRRAIVGDAHGAFNLAAEPVIGPEELGETMRARQLPVPVRVARALTDITWRLRLQPSPVGWLDMALNVPLMDTTRARKELGWEPRQSSTQALLDLLEGIREREGMPTPPLEPDEGIGDRADEVRTGVGGQ